MRALRADEIEVRVGQIYEKGATMLLYKNARVDMAILDEEFGPENWQRDHKEIKGNLYCGIGVWNDKAKTWVWKWDCGTESYTEKEKGEASDSFKRAGFNWGIGRELYTAPFIWFPVATVPNGKGGYRLNNPKELNGLFVSEFEVAELNGKREIAMLAISQRAQGKVGEVWRMK